MKTDAEKLGGIPQAKVCGYQKTNQCVEIWQLHPLGLIR